MARRSARLVSATLFAGVCLLAGGCGSHGASTGAAGASGGSVALSPADAAFKRAFIAQLGPLRNVGSMLSTALVQAPTQSDAQVHAAFAHLATLTLPVVDGVKSLRATPRYRADVATMQHYLSRARRDLRAVARTAAAHQTVKVKRAILRVERDSAVIKAADRRLTTGLGIPAPG